MIVSQDWRNRLAIKLILCSICLLVLSPLVAKASLPIPRVKAPPIWQEVAEVDMAGWVASNDRWYHGEMGILKTVEQGILVRDLTKGGWNQIRFDVNSLGRPLAELLDVLPELQEASSPQVLCIQASQGPWELAVFATKDETEGYYGHEYDYIATLSHKPDLKVPSHGVLAKEYQAVPGSRLVRAFVPTDGLDDMQGFYFFQVPSPIEAVVAHYAKHPDWEIQSLGILGAFGYNEKTECVLTIIGPNRGLDHDEEWLGDGDIGTSYVIVRGSQQMEKSWGW